MMEVAVRLATGAAVDAAITVSTWLSSVDVYVVVVVERVRVEVVTFI
jgi:hypothetical protein